MSAPSAIRIAVIGTGALGKEHARVYAELGAISLERLSDPPLVARSVLTASLPVALAGVFDLDTTAARQIASRHSTQAFPSLDAACDASDAASIVTPTATHFEIARRFLQRGKHVLIEKPMTTCTVDAAELIELARRNGVVLQVGHVERFNPVFKYLADVALDPRFIEAHRLSPYPGRSTDIGVVMDLMIHDLDVVLAFVRSTVVSVDAVGVSVLSQTEDIANARLRFKNGCVANLTVSRVSPERLRKIRVFSGGAPPPRNADTPVRHQPSYISLDYRAQEGFIYRIAREGEEESSLLKKLLRGKDATIVSQFAGKRVVREPVPIAKEEPLRLELRHFIDCIRERQTPIVSGESAKQALDLALEITRQIGCE